MKRYIDFRSEDWPERMDSRMQAARWAACMEGIGLNEPEAGVIDGYPGDLLAELAAEGWLALRTDEIDESGDDFRQTLKAVMLSTIEEDIDTLATEEYTLVERMLINGGTVTLDSVGELEAAYTLRMRMWCDLGSIGGEPVASLDPDLLELLPPRMMRLEHMERRARIFIFEGMLHGILYVSGFLDDRMPRARFVKEVLQAEDSEKNRRLAGNFLEASFDTYELAGCNLLVHEALADPEMLASTLAEYGAFQIPELTSSQMAASMNGLLPEETTPDEKLQRALIGALRPEYEPHEVTTDLRFLAKQGAPMHALREIMASTLAVLPTEYMDGALREMRHHARRWVEKETRPPQEPDAAVGRLH